MSPYKCIHCNTSLKEEEVDKHSCPGKEKAREELLKSNPVLKIPIPYTIRDIALNAVSSHVDGLVRSQAVEQLRTIRDYINKVFKVNNIE